MKNRWVQDRWSLKILSVIAYLASVLALLCGGYLVCRFALTGVAANVDMFMWNLPILVLGINLLSGGYVGFPIALSLLANSKHSSMQ